MSAQEGLVDRLRRRSDFFRTLNETTAATIADEAADAITSLESELAEARGQRNNAAFGFEQELALKKELAGALRDAQAENARLLNDNATLREALESIRLYANDTLSGRVDGPDDREWQRQAVIEIAIAPAPPLPDMSRRGRP